MKELARAQRKNQPLAANRMWYFLRNRRLKGHKFIRELVIDSYIADFVCRERNLILEIDGSQHSEAVEYDELRTRRLMTYGYKVLRVWNNEVFNNIEGVLERILKELEG